MSDTPDGAPAPAASSPVRRALGWPETRDVIAVSATLGFLGAYALPWFVPVPTGADNYLGQMQGALITQWAGIMGWYFGASKGAAETRQLLGKALDKAPDAQ